MKKILLILFVTLALVGDLKADTNQSLQSDDGGSTEQDETVEVLFLMNHEIEVVYGEDILSEKKRCIDELVAKTKESFSVEYYRVMNITLGNKDGVDNIHCKISVKTK